MNKLAIIGGTGLKSIADVAWEEFVPTPYSQSPIKFQRTEMAGHEVFFINRHGGSHTVPPHKVNYRANIWALYKLGIKQIIAIYAVGGITDNMPPEQLVVPDQLIDYTYGRKNTFYEDHLEKPVHFDFSFPFNQALRQALIKTTKQLGFNVVEKATYAVTQGPRLETAAEIDRLDKDGCHIVGMTAMPEVLLAHEQYINIAGLALVVNKAAGRNQDKIIDEQDMWDIVDKGRDKIRQIILNTIKVLPVPNNQPKVGSKLFEVNQV